MTARSSSPSVHEPIAAGVMFFEYSVAGRSEVERLAAGAEQLRLRPDPEYFVQSRSVWHVVQPTT